jgi:hypothetical protein
MSLCKTTCQVPTVTKQSNNISKKMFQAQMIRTNGKYTYKYSNSKTDTINQIIISQNYAANKELIFSLGINGYMNYYKPLAVQYKITNIAETILRNLTPDEQGILNCAKPPPVEEPVLPLVPIEGKTFYVISVKTNTYTDLNWSFFVFKNYSSDDFLIPTYTYTFDMSHPSNAGTKLSFSFFKEGDPLDSKYLVYTGNLVKVTLPKNINYTNLYPYNETEPNIYLKYNKSGYTVGSFYIKTSSFAQAIENGCDPTYTPIGTPVIYTYNNKSYELLYLTASSLVYGYENNGIRLTIKDINLNETLQYISNRKFGMSEHLYRIYVPQMYKLAILNSGQESNITYFGDPEKVTRDVLVIGTEADDIYDFYYGTINIVVTGSFQPISLYTLDYGYLGAKQVLVYAPNPNEDFDLNPYIFPF